MTPEREQALCDDVSQLKSDMRALTGIVDERLPERPHCELHQERVERVEKRVDGLCSGMWALALLTFGGFVAAFFGYLFR